jgi:serine/threonine-protein kinase
MLTEGMYLADRYEIVSKVGAGGMSDVYKAKDHILGRFVAIKVLKQEFSEDRNFVTKFRTEAQSAAGLEHPNIVNIYDVGSEDGLHYIVMEYIEGITLKTYIEKKGQLSFKESVSIAIQVSRGIEAAHNKNIIHRDIKPHNIIISTEGKVKVTDFGIAKAASANTISSDVMGSVHYASPEQARNGFVDSRSDIYSLGIVMYEMVTGRVPFDGDTTVAVAIQHLQEEMVSPKTYAPNLPVSMEKIILKCAQKNPDRRYQNIAELLADLRKSLVSPDEDFVVIAPIVDSGKTKVISEEEVQQIKSSAAPVIKNETEKPAPKEPVPDEPEYDDEDDEEDEDDVLNPAMDKAVTIMGIVFAVLIVIVIIVLAMKLSRLFGGTSTADSSTQTTEVLTTELDTTGGESETQPVEKVPMINILGMTYDEAVSRMEEIGLSLHITATEKSDEPEGTILSANVGEGDQIAVGSVIDVVVAGEADEDVEDENSAGNANDNVDNEETAADVIVPSVVGYSESTATSALNNAGLVPNPTYEYSSDVPKGEVITQDPVAGSSVKKNSSVTLVVSSGIEQVKVPDVLGKSQAKATEKLEAKGFTVVVEEAYSDEVAEGKVISQSVAGGDATNAGSQITITVSLGEMVVYYSFSKEFSVPENAVSVAYTLSMEDGEIISSQSELISEGTTSITISKININAESGYLELFWTIASTDEEGNQIETEEVGFDGTVDFSVQ